MKKNRVNIEERSYCTEARRQIQTSSSSADEAAPRCSKSVSGDIDTRSCQDPWKGDT